jgi:hypothetical protein
MIWWYWCFTILLSSIISILVALCMWNKTISYLNDLLQRHHIVQQGILWDPCCKQCRLNLKEESGYKSVVVNALAL